MGGVRDNVAAAGVKPGPHMGEALRKLKDQWKASTYTLTAQQLLSTVSS
jgi:hypothetical protein